MAKDLYAISDYLGLFPLAEPYEFGMEKSKEITEKMIGRSIDEPHDSGILAQYVMNAKHGDHVEIGTFYGHSAILIACAKKEFGMHGKIYCVDPLQYNPAVKEDWGTGGIATDQIIMENAAKFGVEDYIKIVPHKSYPWPVELEGKTFATGYIDGDHWNGMPKRDWNTLKEVVTYSIAFDDYCLGKTEVIQAAIDAFQDPNWIPVYVGGLKAIVRRRH